MGKPKARSILYRLIEAGQLTRRALLVPLVERGLEPGDDAVLFLLHDRLGASDADLHDALSIDHAALLTRIDRLVAHDLVERRAIGPTLTPGLALTERGERVREVLSGNWSSLEDALLEDLPKKQRKRLRQTLGRFVKLLKL
jgi:DNA-binding MarR family transcriptional regulator